MQRRVSPEGADQTKDIIAMKARTDQTSQIQEARKTQTFQNMAVSVFCASFSWTVSGKLREEWAVRTYTISNERFISKQGRAQCSRVD